MRSLIYKFIYYGLIISLLIGIVFLHFSRNWIDVEVKQKVTLLESFERQQHGEDIYNKIFQIETNLIWNDQSNQNFTTIRFETDTNECIIVTNTHNKIMLMDEVDETIVTLEKFREIRKDESYTFIFPKHWNVSLHLIDSLDQVKQKFRYGGKVYKLTTSLYEAKNVVQKYFFLMKDDVILSNKVTGDFDYIDQVKCGLYEEMKSKVDSTETALKAQQMREFETIRNDKLELDYLNKQCK